LEQCAGLSCNVHAENLTNDSNSLNATLSAEVVDETVDLPAESDHSVKVSVDSPGNVYAGPPCGASIIVSNSRPSSRDQEGDLLPDSTVGREARRRLKNREAAARSNARRRERNAALKNELSEAVRKASELRRIETMLRSENIALRRRFGSFLPKE
jgi:bZIP Maf transcription factor